MSKSKMNTIIFLIAIITVIIIILVILLAYFKIKFRDSTRDMSMQEIGSGYLDDYAKVENDNINKGTYQDVNTCISQYLNIINLNNFVYLTYDEQGSEIVDTNQAKQKIYNVLSEKFISQNNITTENVLDKIKTMETPSLYIPLETKLLQNGDIINFVAHGLVEDLDLEVIDEIYILVNIDPVNLIFSIEPIYEEYSNISEIQLNKYENSIKSNEDNKFVLNTTSYEKEVKNYITLYKRLAIGSPEKMYNLLDKEYREAKFGSVDKFKEYVKNNKKEIMAINADSYQVTTTDDYTQYICIDKSGKYYIFREKTVNDYSVLLDTYTIDIPEFVKKYNESTMQERVMLNLNKFMLAINEKDYKYAYNVLADSFKSNNFKTLEDFENYAKSNFFEKNEFNYQKFGDEANTYYTYEVDIKDKSGNSSAEITKTFIMLLDDGTNFELSFNI